MHKLAKGLKKKKKQKKGKKGEEDEFDPEELERYRRERAEAQQKAEVGESASEEQSSSTKSEAEPDWKKFLSTKFDTVIHQTQDDLDRIKSTSFYQRKEPEPEPEPEPDPEEEKKKAERKKRYIGFDKDGNPIEAKDEDDEEDQQQERGQVFAVNEEGLVEVPDDDDDEQAYDDIFDTDYIDAIQNVEVEFAYIPDSPTLEELGDDPFDTSEVDKVLKTVDKTGRKLVSLGNAVEVLAGRIDHVSSCKISKTRPRVQTDLLLADFDAEVPTIVTEDADETDSRPIDVQKTLLDDDSDLPDIPIDLTKLPPIFSRPVTPAHPEGEENQTEANKPLDFSEFELFPDKTLLDEVPTLDEFDLEAPVEELVLVEEEDPFAEKEPENLDLEEEFADISFAAATFVNEEDPFDTTIADNILPGKTELKFIERELEQTPKVSISIARPPGLLKGQTTLNVAKKDLLGGSNTDLNKLADKPIQPVEEISYVDPFDTSNFKELPPGQTELKILEKELLNSPRKVLQDLDDDDFDPRAGETPAPEKPKPPRPTLPPSPVPEVKLDEDFEAQAPPVNLGRKPSRPEALDITPKVVAFAIPTLSNKTDLLAAGEEEKSLPGKPLTPYYPQKSLDETLPIDEETEDAEADPFDTSSIAAAPGKTELKIIESELLQDETDGVPRSISDHDFNTRSRQPSITSAEVIEELINKRKKLDKRQDSILDTAIEVNAEFLAPTVQPNPIEEEEELAYKDPFDTSHAKNILPGKAELKILENELSQLPDPEPLKPHPVFEEVAKKLAVEVDPDFDPRAGETKDFLGLDTEEVPSGKVLTPIQDSDLPEEDIDPFDTSFADIGPGKTELKLLESELIDK